jgi:hypothetical protein
MTRFPPPPPGAERRAHPRHDVVVSVSVAHDDTVAIATLVNVSQGGAFVEVADFDALAVGVRVRLGIAAGGKDVKAEARVVRATSGPHAGFALAWLAPSAALRKLIDRLVATAPAVPAASAPVATAAATSAATSPETAIDASVDASW